jgi:ElaB/YqjD/DUF883 family membrane-anchored ribosome-binding protein
MIIRLHFVNQGQPLDQHSVTSRSPRVFAQMRGGCAELTMLPDGAGSWARRAAIAKVRQHQPLLDQLEALAVLVDGARSGKAAAGSQALDTNAALLSQARELASSIGDATLAAADAGLREIEREVRTDVEAARSLIRRHPLRAISIAAIASAILTGLCRRRR